MGCLRVLLAFLFPPLAVIHRGLGAIAIVTVLTILGYIPGVVAALILASDDPGTAAAS